MEQIEAVLEKDEILAWKGKPTSDAQSRHYYKYRGQYIFIPLIITIIFMIFIFQINLFNFFIAQISRIILIVVMITLISICVFFFLRLYQSRRLKDIFYAISSNRLYIVFPKVEVKGSKISLKLKHSKLYFISTADFKVEKNVVSCDLDLIRKIEFRPGKKGMNIWIYWMMNTSKSLIPKEDWIVLEQVEDTKPLIEIITTNLGLQGPFEQFKYPVFLKS